MNDPELRSLIQQFQTLQRKQTGNQINERNIVEIVNIIHKKKKLIEVLHTTDGKEYLTWEQLRREIVDELAVNSGRINVIDLPGTLNVDMVHIEKAIPVVLAEDSTIRLEGGELITQQYLDTAVESAADILREKGSLSITEFAKSHKLTSMFATTLLTNAVAAGRMPAVIQDSSVYNRQFVRSQRRIARAGLLGAAQPLRVAEFFQRNDLFTPLLQTIMTELKDELPGRFDGDTYIPSSFEKDRATQISNVYLSNGVIAYSFLQQLGIGNARQYLLARFNPPSGTEKNDTRGGTSGAMAEGRHAGKGRGGRKKTGTSAAATASNSCGATPSGAQASAEYPHAGYALSLGFLSDRLLSGLHVMASLEAGEVTTVDLREHLPPTFVPEDDFAAIKLRLQQLYPSCFELCEVVGSCVFVRRSLWEAAIKPKITQLAQSQKSSVASSDASRSVAAQNLSPKDKDETLKVFRTVVAVKGDEKEAVLLELLELWEERVAAVFREARVAGSQSATIDLRRARAWYQKRCQELWTELYVMSKGLQWSAQHLDEAAVQAINRHVLQTRCAEVVKLVVLNESLERPDLYTHVSGILADGGAGSGALPHAVAAPGTDGEPNNFTPAAMKTALAKFTSGQRVALEPMTSVFSGKSVADFMKSTEELASAGIIAMSCFHAPNKKVERETYTAMREAVIQALSRSTFGSCCLATGASATVGSLFAQCVTLALHLLCHVHVELPGKCVTSAVAHLRKDPQAPADLQAAHQVVIGALSGKAPSEEAVALLDRLREALLASP